MRIYNAMNYSSQPAAPAIFCYAINEVFGRIFIVNDEGDPLGNAAHEILPANWEMIDLEE